MYTELIPIHDSRQSFHSKAHVITKKNGDSHLISYTTEVAAIIDGQARVYGDYSHTTFRHQKEFLRQNGFKVESKKQIMADYEAPKPRRDAFDGPFPQIML